MKKLKWEASKGNREKAESNRTNGYYRFIQCSTAETKLMYELMFFGGEKHHRDVLGHFKSKKKCRLIAQTIEDNRVKRTIHV